MSLGSIESERLGVVRRYLAVMNRRVSEFSHGLTQKQTLYNVQLSLVHVGANASLSTYIFFDVFFYAFQAMIESQ